VGHFGEDLRRERESRGVTLETISEKTKVITRYLSALENDDFDALPGGILSKGIVRGYVRTVGLDENTWVERFVSAIEKPCSPNNDENWTEFVQNVSRSRPQIQGARELGMRWAGVALLALLLAGFGWAVWHYVSGHVMADDVQHPAITSTATATPVGDGSR
jgi:cytoskeletal protein RodZ